MCEGSSSDNCCDYEYGYLKELDDLSEKGKSQQVWNDEIMGYIDLYRCRFLFCEIIYTLSQNSLDVRYNIYNKINSN